LISALHKIFQYIAFTSFMAFIICNQGGAQDTTIVNQYARIIGIQNADSTDVDSVEVDHPEFFESEDTVLFIVMKGTEIVSPLDFPPLLEFKEFWGKGYNPNNAGIYNILLVNKKVGNHIIFTTVLRKLSEQKPGEVYQLVKVRGGQSVYEVNEPHTCKKWNPMDSTGGVFVLIAGRKIVLNDVIDVTGKGFFGGDPNSPAVDYFEGNCSEAVDSFYTEAASDSSGRKGESFVYEGFPLTRGMLFVLTGGGGGNGKYSGGGGGGNYGTGGQGGKESESCSLVSDNLGGLGNFLTTTDYYNNDRNRIFMGGGGGTGTQHPDSGRFATKGGNGGGIIILITDTIEANGANMIRAGGQSVTDTATAGAGGGGGGGVIVLDANTYVGEITLDVKGGDGGWTNHQDPTGPGGFGGGGLIWHSGDNLTANVMKNINNGVPGQHKGTDTRGATTTSNKKGGVINNLMIPISGFLFNVMPEDQDICEGNSPVPFYASKPKGGTGEYDYTWQRSAGMIDWNDAPGKNDSIYYVSGPLTDTTYFRRIVESGATIDTSLILTINVLPALQNNNIAPDDTICKGSVIPDLKDDPFFNITGGNGTYTFLWESKTESTAWISTGVTDTILTEQTPLETTFYRRVVRSHVCVSTSDSVTITVLDNIHDNLIAPDDTICEDENGLPVTGQNVSGGDPGDYRYLWQSGMDTLNWDPAKIPNDQKDYDPDTLKSTRYYRRLVYSGPDDACIDTSNFVQILVHPHITNNLIARDTIICADDPNLILTQQSGSVGGGDGIKYSYEWQSKTQEGSWVQAGLNDTMKNYVTGYLTDTIRYRRFVRSGACSDTSNDIIVMVQDSILNNLVAESSTICRGAVPDPITGQSDPTGGNGIYAYQWQKRLNSTGWEDIAGAIQPGYSPPSLEDTTYYRRKVVSGKCSNFSDSDTVIVQALITNNTIKNGLWDETCYETSLLLDGTAGITEMGGGDEAVYEFSWEKSNDSINWIPVPGTNGGEDYSTEDLLLPAYFRRNVESGACTDISASTFVSVNPRPAGRLVDTTYAALCYDSVIGPVNIPVQYMLTGTPPYNMIYHDGFSDDTIENIISGQGNFTCDFITPDTTLYEIELVDLVDANGCIAYADSLSGLVSAVLYKRPGAEIMNDKDTMICDYMIQIESQEEVGSGYWTKVAGDEYLTIDDSASRNIWASTEFHSKNSQYYKLYRINYNWPVVTEDKCSSRDSIEVIFWQEPDPAHAGSKPSQEYDTIVYFADYLYLYADTPTAGTGKWTVHSGSAVVENDTLPGTFVDLGDENLDKTVEYQLQWTITNGVCQATSDELRISRRDLRIYEGFSPDGNGINDFFTIEGLDYADTYDFKIFTRSGNLIKRITKSTGEEGLPGDRLWDGTYDGGRPVENGIYYYTLEVKKGDQDTYQYRGFIVVTRGQQ
jgi:gliding motility-associated-like protein